ncbi:glutathione peroxidase [Aliidongia dinghuensis]|uniref:Glutathione peroxidase n=1 Tax=Aliidongia dinghuensis TaxID=1867774 RepID=A0A8J2YVK6_9PROT|nr:glutathione peroxidase [Aliidongia dinghuensis]GGF22086.1 glutathione peroxidase [Aliidongia dinghuensis]
MSAFDFSFISIDGRPMPLAAYRGKVLLVVNVASYCGLTPQYEGLEALSRQYRDQGLVVIGVPANDFGAQEPGTEAEIQEFCTTRFAVDFPMTAKEPVVGSAAHPFYQWAVTELGADAAPKWNFHKYLVGRDGAITSFGSRTTPDAPELVGAIEAALRG